MKVFFGYDDIVCNGDITAFKEHYYYNCYEDKSIPINGHSIIRETYAHVENTIVRNTSNLTVSCQQYPIETILKNNNFDIIRDTTANLLKNKQKFIYNLAPKYFARLNSNCIPGTSRDVNGKILLQYNYLKALLTRDIINAINNDECLLIISDIMECTWYTESLLSTFKLLCVEAGINYKKIIILTSNVSNANNPFVEESGLQVYFWQYWETAVRHLFSKSKIAVHNNHLSSKYRFLLLNSRPRRHRQYLCYKLWQHDTDFYQRYCVSAEKATLLQLQTNFDYAARDGYKNSITFFNTVSDDEEQSFNTFCELLPFHTPYEQGVKQRHILQKLKSEQYISNYNAVTPFFKINHWNNIVTEMVYETDIHIVTESLMEIKNTENVKHLFYSEKSFKPIATGAPFIIAGQPGTLSYLKRCGYKTFDSCWDESYDNIEDPQKRIDKIIEVVLSLSRLSNCSYTNMVKDAYEIAKYNYKIFVNRIPEIQLVEKVQSFFKEK